MTDNQKSPEDAKRAEESREVWQKFGERFGWRLCSWEFDKHAIFLTRKYPHNLVTIESWVRESIEAAFERMEKEHFEDVLNIEEELMGVAFEKSKFHGGGM